MQMILKSMGVKVDKDDMDNYCAEVDEEATGKFSFSMFCAVSAKFMIEDDEEQMRRPQASSPSPCSAPSPPSS